MRYATRILRSEEFSSGKQGATIIFSDFDLPDHKVRLEDITGEFSISFSECRFEGLRIAYSEVRDIALSNLDVGHESVVLSNISCRNIAMYGIRQNDNSNGDRLDAILINRVEAAELEIVQIHSMGFIVNGCTVNVEARFQYNMLRTRNSSQSPALRITNCPNLGAIDVEESDNLGGIRIGDCVVPGSITISGAISPRQQQPSDRRNALALLDTGITVSNCRVGDDLSVANTEVHGKIAVIETQVADQISIKHNTILRTPTSEVVLQGSSAGSFDEEHAVGFDRFLLGDFRYGNLVFLDKTRERQRVDRWFPQPLEGERVDPIPYEYLASFYHDRRYRDLENQTHFKQAENTYATFNTPSIIDYVWYHWVGKIVVFGHKPERSLSLLLFLWPFGSCVFWIANRFNVFYDASPGAGTHSPTDISTLVSPLAYSFDAMTPLLSLGQNDRWAIDPNRGARLTVLPVLLQRTWLPELRLGRLLRAYYWLHVVLGWLLTTLFIVTLSGIFQAA